MIKPGKQLGQLVLIAYRAESSPLGDDIAVNERPHGELTPNLAHKLSTGDLNELLDLPLGRERCRVKDSHDRLVRCLGLFGTSQTLL